MDNNTLLRWSAHRSPALTCRRRSGFAQRRAGLVLILVLVVIAILALGAYTFSELMLTERRAVEAQGRKMQTRSLAESGVAQIMQHLAQTKTFQSEQGGHYDNPALFRGVLVVDGADATERGRFTLVSAAYDQGYRSGFRFGLEDESTKLNLNVLPLVDAVQSGAGRNILMQLPSMTEDVADAIIDWIDTDETSGQYGAESDYYSSVVPAYGAKNAPLESIDELLMVRGVYPRLLFGLDEDRNGFIDARERTYEAELGVDNSDGSMDFGWSSYLTLHSGERNVRDDGTPKINLNQANLEVLHEQLSAALGEQQANFIVAYRQYGPANASQSNNPNGAGSGGGGGGSNGGGGGASGGGSSGGDSSGGQQAGGGQQSGRGQSNNGQSGRGGSSGGGSSGSRSGGGSSDSTTPAVAGPDEVDFTKQAAHQFTSVLDLIDANIQIESTKYKSPFTNTPAEMEVYLPVLMEAVSVSGAPKLPGRININQAPIAILLGIPGMTPEIAEQILAVREPDVTDESSARRYETWLLSEGIVTLDQMKTLMPFVNAGGDVYRASVVGYYDSKGPMARLDVIIDASGGTPRVVSWRDLSHLGGGYSRLDLGSDTAQ